MYSFIRSFTLLTVCHLLFRVSYKNLEILDSLDKCLICPNHSRIFDPIFLYPKVSNMYSVAKSELFQNKWMANLLTYHQAFPIKRGENDICGIKSILKLLKQQDNIKLLIFPEGGIFKENYKDQKRNTKNGAVYLSASSNLPIIPVHITVRPRFFSKVTVTFGSPILPDRSVLKDKELLNQKANELIHIIYEL